MSRPPQAAALPLTALFLGSWTSLAFAQTQSIPVELPTVYAPPQANEAASNSAGVLAPQQLDQLVAPIALYPDPLLTNILAAATYPVQIAEAQRFAAANQGVQGAALTDAAAGHHWDPSVLALLNFPQVLQQLDSNLEWTDRLGQAFVAQQADVLNAVQRLRSRAQAAGTLANTPQDDVVNEGGDIAILPPSDQQIFVPTYDAACVYGSYAGCPNDAVSWGDGLWLPYGTVAWGILDWGHRRIAYNGTGGPGLRRGGWNGRGHGGTGGRGDGHGGEGGFGGVWHHAGPVVAGTGRAPAEIGSVSQFGPDPAGLAGVKHFQVDAARLGSLARGQTGDDQYNYAPPSGVRLDQGGFGGGFRTAPIAPRPIAPTAFGRGPTFQNSGPRGAAAHAAPAPAPAGVAHGFGGGHR